MNNDQYYGVNKVFLSKKMYKVQYLKGDDKLEIHTCTSRKCNNSADEKIYFIIKHFYINFKKISNKFSFSFM